ncbi:SGNH/GDSL hydrolase family protein [Lederbergia sp. NSJ-179]|uniref:SGNH/GDSL hydrolase family protein n=1 Tax=Lederbergia sp. NSJ-179 TaxID=2931402 RepID=UPI001FD4D9DD|nr:SGNH/GDSL hydrolase family protein [Lederbergia sp. NSJ-179]MCJ7841144.1 SGNH/GDSL hydrolase family protein [Lederbergia sp. NSJ-179]
MKRFVLLFICLMFVLSGCSTPYQEQRRHFFSHEYKQPPPADFIPHDLSIVSIGDSLTRGVGDVKESGGYIPYLKEKLESQKSIKTADFINLGVRGNRTDQLLKRLDQFKVKTAIQNADIIIITIGGNDVMKVFKQNITHLKVDTFLEEEKYYRERLTNIIQTISTYNNKAEIILMGIYNPFMKWFADIKEMDQIITSWNDTSAEVVDQFAHTSFVPVEDIFNNFEEDLLYKDYFHPNNKGYELIADRFYMYFNEHRIIEQALQNG